MIVAEGLGEEKEHWVELKWGSGGTMRIRHKLIVSLIPKKSGAVLDLGAGFGDFFETEGLPITSTFVGVDCEVDRLRRGRDVAICSWQALAADACCLPFVDSVFDCTVSIGLLQLMGLRFPQVVREMVRTTQNGGLIIIETLNQNSLTWRPQSQFDNTELTMFTPEVLTGCLDDFGVSSYSVLYIDFRQENLNKRAVTSHSIVVCATK